jgi:hypothetical protein
MQKAVFIHPKLECIRVMEIAIFICITESTAILV